MWSDLVGGLAENDSINNMFAFNNVQGGFTLTISSSVRDFKFMLDLKRQWV